MGHTSKNQQKSGKLHPEKLHLPQAYSTVDTKEKTTLHAYLAKQVD